MDIRLAYGEMMQQLSLEEKTTLYSMKLSFSILLLYVRAHFSVLYYHVLTALSVEYKTLKTKKGSDLHRMWHTANIVEGNMYVFGGKSKKQETTNELWKLDLSNF